MREEKEKRRNFKKSDLMKEKRYEEKERKKESKNERKKEIWKE